MELKKQFSFTARILGCGLMAIASAATMAHATEFHVAPNGADSNPGTQAAPLRTIQRAADLAHPNDVITVHQGVYRERISPPRGGQSETARITYQAATGDHVEIKGSEVVTNWTRVQEDLWKVTLPNGFFGKFNPYSDRIHGDWFTPKGREHHTGAVYLNGQWLTEAAKLDELLKPLGNLLLWFGQVDKDHTTIWAQFKGVDPNEQQVEINVRQAVFYPEKPGVNFITVRGFTMRHAATPWAPPTAEQIGLIGTHWSKGWIIERNIISHSKCSGIALGKYGDQWDNTSADTAEGYVTTIHRALTNGWNKQTIGHHLVRNNDISYCEQTGIVGSLGCSFSTISSNSIHDIHIQQLFSGAEMAGIKFHGAIDVEISHNHIYRTIRGIWLDWMAQGAHVTSNLLHDNQDQDLFLEVNHGPFLVANNIFLSRQFQRVVSQGGAYAHNLVAGDIAVLPFDARLTPFHVAHSTELAGMSNNPSGDVRYYNNLLTGTCDMSCYDDPQLPVWMSGNVYLTGAKPSRFEKNPLLSPKIEPQIKLVEKQDGFYLELVLDKAAERAGQLVTTQLLGLAAIPKLPFEHPDGTPIRLTTDYFGKQRNEANPASGPFETAARGLLRLKVW